MSRDLKRLWRDNKSPYARLICRKCAPEAFPAESLQQYPVDSYHIGDRFQVFDAFGITFNIYLDGKPTRCVSEARVVDQESHEGWVIEQVVLGQLNPVLFETAKCACATPPDGTEQAERVRFGRVTMVPRHLSLV